MVKKLLEKYSKEIKNQGLDLEELKKFKQTGFHKVFFGLLKPYIKMKECPKIKNDYYAINELFYLFETNIKEDIEDYVGHRLNDSDYSYNNPSFPDYGIQNQYLRDKISKYESIFDLFEIIDKKYSVLKNIVNHLINDMVFYSVSSNIGCLRSGINNSKLFRKKPELIFSLFEKIEEDYKNQTEKSQNMINRLRKEFKSKKKFEEFINALRSYNNRLFWFYYHSKKN